MSLTWPTNLLEAEEARDPVHVLVEERDPMVRSRAHRVLGLRARAREDLDRAVWHLREAIELDPTDETSKEILKDLAPTGVEKPRGWFSRMVASLRSSE